MAASKPKSKTAKKPRVKSAIRALDVSAFPPEMVTQEDRRVCLACVLDVLTRHLKLLPAKAQTEIRRYEPSLEELRAKPWTRPFFAAEEETCPYCGAAARWHARLAVYRIESGKSTDAPRRTLLKSLSEKDFAVVEEKATRQDAFFQWAERISTSLDPEDPRWLREVSRNYLGRKEPKQNWDELFGEVRSIRRSRRLEAGWELDQGRLFLAPHLFDELLLVQYLMSRAHRSGGWTLEGRYTLAELFARLRNSGYLRAAGVEAHNPSDAFEALLTHLGGGESAARFHYIVDRRDLLERLKTLKNARVPKAS